MKLQFFFFLVVLPATLGIRLVQEWPEIKECVDDGVPLSFDMGAYNGGAAISTTNSLVRDYFNQAMVLGHGYNHDEGLRTVQRALLLDPNCPMLHWALAKLGGPNINRGLDDARLPVAQGGAAAAMSNIKRAKSQREKDLIRAMSVRYAGRTTGADPVLDMAYAQEMRALANKYPKDAEIQTLAAEALIETTPWNYWQTTYHNGYRQTTSLYHNVTDAMDFIERALKLDPNRMYATHLMIHVYEAGPRDKIGKRLGEVSDLLWNAVPKSNEICLGHLHHMPSHGYLRIGRYADAYHANVVAVDSDVKCFQSCGTYSDSERFGYNNVYRNGYYCHNMGFVIQTAMLAGNSGTAIEYGKFYEEQCMASAELFTFGFAVGNYLQWRTIAYNRFNMPQHVLKDPLVLTSNDAVNEMLLMIHLSQRAEAWARLGNCLEAKTIATQYLDMYTKDAIHGGTPNSFWKSEDVYEMMYLYMVGMLNVYCEGHGLVQGLEGATPFEQAAEIEGMMPYFEPYAFPINIGSCAGSYHLLYGNYTGAEDAFRKDLLLHIDNGWSLKGLQLALEGQGLDATSVKADFDAAWAAADYALLDNPCFPNFTPPSMKPKTPSSPEDFGYSSCADIQQTLKRNAQAMEAICKHAKCKYKVHKNGTPRCFVDPAKPVRCKTLKNEADCVKAGCKAKIRPNGTFGQCQ